MKRVTRHAWFVGIVLWALPVQSQDDWSLTREPARPSRPAKPVRRPAAAQNEPAPRDLSERYVRALLTRPSDGFALERLRELSLARDGSLDGVVQRFEAEVTKAPASPLAREALARVLALAGQGPRAVTELDALLAAERGAARERLALLRAELLRELGRPEEARAGYEAFLREGGTRDARLKALRGLGELAIAAGDLDGAEARYRELTNAGGGGSPEGVEWPRALSQAGRKAEAARAYVALAERLRGDARITGPLLREAARAALDAGDHDEAIRLVGRAMTAASEGERAELYDLSIEAHRKAGRLNELADQLAKEAQTRPRLTLRAAMLWDELGRETEALEAYRAVLERTPRDIDTRARLARLLARSGRLDELLREYTELVALAPDEPSFVVALAELLREGGERAKGLAVLARAGQRAPRSLSLHRALLDLYTRWGAHAEAERELLLLTRLDPDDDSHVIALGDEAFERGDKAGALKIWQRVLDNASDRAEAHATLASVLGDHGLFDPAIEHATRAVELAPDRIDLRRSLGSLLERGGKALEAEVVYRYVLDHAGDDAAVRREARQHLVNIWLRTGVAPRRAQELEMRFRSEPPDLEAGRSLAELYAHDPARAAQELAVLQQVAQKAPGDVETLRALERAYTRRGALDQAQATLDALVKADPASAGAYLARAVDLALSRYRDDEALAYAQRAVQIRPKDGKVQRLLGDLYRRKQDLDAAVKAYERAAELDARDHDTRLLLAQIEAARGREDAAERWLIQVVEGSPDDELVARAARTAMELTLPEGSRENLELRLLELCLKRPERPLYRRLLVESYARRFGLIIARVQRGVASDAERAQVERVGGSSIKPLLEALADSDPLQRNTALDLLGAARVRHAGGPLMTLAEQGDGAVERARALAAVGLLGDASLGPRLRKLIAKNERRLMPMALWALSRSEGEKSKDVLLGRLRDGRDASVRVLCALSLGALNVREASPLFVSLARERHAALRAAALWALSRLDGASQRPLFVEALDAPLPASLVALSALPDDYDVLVRALSSATPAHRALAVRLIARPASALVELPAPRLPFVARAYVTDLVERDERPPDAAQLEARFPLLAQAFERLLAADVPARAAAVESLAPYAGGLVPQAFLEQGLCPPATLGKKLAQALWRALGDLAQNPRFAARDRALSLLAASGGAEQPSVLEALRTDTPTRLLVLEALASAGPPSAVTTSELLSVFDRAEDWPARLRIARVLGSRLGKERLAREPVQLVRSAALARAGAGHDAAPVCSEGPLD